MTFVKETAAQEASTNGRPRSKRSSIVNPTRLEVPAFLLNFPFSFTAEDANNAWMTELKDDERTIAHRRARRQFLDFYHYLSSECLVYVLPTPRDCGLQDLVFTANIGIAMEHLEDEDVVVVSNYTAEGRRGETAVGERFFESLGYRAVVSPYRFEGEADLKHLHDNVYVGGYGQRSDRKTYEWMEREFGMQIVKVEMEDEYLYHLDTMLFPITREDSLVCTKLLDKSEVAEIEKHTNVIDVTEDECYQGITNSVRMFNTILNGSNISDLKAGTEDYKLEIAKNRRLEDLGAELGFEIAYFNISEYLKGGALLSCMAMHLNRRSYDVRLL